MSRRLYDITIVRGDTFDGTVIVTDGTGPVDLTGASGVIQVRRDDVVVAEAPITITDAAGGEFEFEIPADDTSDIAEGRHDYAIRLTLADGSKKTVVRGELTVRTGVV